MQAGYIYALKNKSFEDYVIKIGRTVREPDTRAREMYSGASGVPEPFDIAFACRVSDCVEAEKRVHNKLQVYRRNRDREFFIIPIQVVRRVILDICQGIEKSLGSSIKNLIVIDIQNLDELDCASDNVCNDNSSDLIEVDIEQLVLSAPGRSLLSKEQEERIEVIAEIFRDVFPDAIQHWLTDFSRDAHPEDEILIWENLAKAFLKIDQVKYLSEQQKQEAFFLLLMRTMTPASKILESFKSKTFCKRVIKEILGL